MNAPGRSRTQGAIVRIGAVSRGARPELRSREGKFVEFQGSDAYPDEAGGVELTPARDRQFELPVFRSDHPLRKQLVRIGAAVLAVLFVAWAVAVASGILGFGALPGLSGLPGVSENEPGSSGGSEASKPAATQPNRSMPAPSTGSRNQTSSVGELPGGPPGRGQSPGSPEPDAKSPSGSDVASGIRPDHPHTSVGRLPGAAGRPPTADVPSRPVRSDVPSRPVGPDVPSRPVGPEVPSGPVRPVSASRTRHRQAPSDADVRTRNMRRRIERPPAHWSLLACVVLGLLAVIFLYGLTNQGSGGSATGTGAPAAASGHAASPILSAQDGELRPVGRVKANEVALTFDDGPDPEWTERIAAVLRQLDVPATFFQTGEQVGSNPRDRRRAARSGL